MGIAASLQYGTERGFAACLFTPVDTPMLGEHDLQQLIQVWRRNTDVPVVANSDRPEPLIAIYPTDRADAFRKLAESEQRSLWRWIEDQECRSVSLSTDACRNLNTPEDYKNLHG